MWNVFENSWLLLTLAGVALVAISIYRQVNPAYGRKLLPVPLLIAILGFCLDAAVQSDYESIALIVKSCKVAAVSKDSKAILAFVSPNYADSFHKSKTDLETAAEVIIQRASIEKFKTQSHTISLNGTRAESELEGAIHLGMQNDYTGGMSLVFVGLKFNFEKIGKNWFIQRVELTSVNFDPTNWGDVR